MKQIDRQRDRALQTDGSAVALFNLFVQITRDQLHIVIVMSPIGTNFRNRIRKFPALVNCCTIDWLQVFFHTIIIIMRITMMIMVVVIIITAMAARCTASSCN